MKKFVYTLFAFLALAIVFTGCSKGSSDKGLTMGFVPMKDADKMVEDIKPLEEMVTKEMGEKVKGFIASNYVSVVEGLGTGQVDFGFIPPFACVLANQESGAEPVLVALNKDGKATYQSQILVDKNSGIKSIADIKGKKVAFVEPSSTSGYLFPAALMVEKGIDIDKDIQPVFAGGHDKALQLLLNGDVDVACTFVDTRVKFAKEFPDAMEKTEVLALTEPIPGVSICVSSKMDKDTREKLVKSLKAVGDSKDGKELLTKLFNIHGFQDASMKDYEVIKRTAEALKLDLKEQK